MSDSDGEHIGQAPDLIQSLTNHIHVWEVPASKGKSRIIAAAAYLLQQQLQNQIDSVVIYFPSALVKSKDEHLYTVMSQ